MDESKKIEDVVKGLGKLPTLPGIAMRILEAVGKDETSLKEIADILSTDPPLSIEILKGYKLPTLWFANKNYICVSCCKSVGN